MNPREPKASDLNGGRDHGRQIGHGVTIAHVAVALCVTVLAWRGAVDGLFAVGAFLVTFAAVFAGDLYVQYVDIKETNNRGRSPGQAEAAD